MKKHFGKNVWAGALVLWLWETTCVQEVVGSNPGALYWIDMTFFTLICYKNGIVCLKRPKINEKEVRVGQFEKKHFGKNVHMLTSTPLQVDVVDSYLGESSRHMTSRPSVAGSE